MSASKKKTISQKNEKLEEAVILYLLQPQKNLLEIIIRESAALIKHYVFLFSYSGNFNAEKEDLLQAGYEGVFKALKRYDPQREVLFATYASSCIMGEIRHEIRSQKRYDSPGWIEGIQAKIWSVSEELLQETGRAPTLKEIAKRANLKEEGVIQAMQAGRVPLEEVDISRIRVLRYESFQLPIEDKIMVRQSLSRLTDLQRSTIYLLFFRDLTQQQVADKLGISQRKVSRLKRSGLDQMGKHLSLGEV